MSFPPKDANDTPTHAPGGGPDAPESPWRTRSHREVYRMPWLIVTEYEVIRPDGERGLYAVADPGANVTIVALENDESVWLIREFSYPLQRARWILPAGRVEQDEDPLAAAQRELAEEVGLHADTWQLLDASPLSGGFSTQISHAYLARHLSHGPATPEGTEAIEPRRIPLREAYAACLDGSISDAAVVLAIWHAWALLHGDESPSLR